MSEFDRAYERVSKLARDFEENEAHFKDPKYSEAQARKDFIDKFWIALGWDVNHDRQTNPYEQEVKVERTVAVGGPSDAPTMLSIWRQTTMIFSFW